MDLTHRLTNLHDGHQEEDDDDDDGDEDGDEDIYIMVECLCLCVSQKSDLFNAFWRFKTKSKGEKVKRLED